MIRTAKETGTTGRRARHSARVALTYGSLALVAGGLVVGATLTADDAPAGRHSDVQAHNCGPLGPFPGC